MGANQKVAIALFVGVAIGSLTVQGIYAQAKPTAFVVAEAEVIEPEGYKTFLEKNGKGIADAGGHFVVRGGQIAAIQGEAPKRIAISMWETLDQAKAYYSGKVWTDLAPLREKTAKIRIYAVEGVAK